jgi:hypothetical protein
MYVWFTQTALPEVQRFIEGPVTAAIKGFINLVGGIWAGVSGALGELHRWFTQDALPAIVGQVKGPVTTAIQGLIDIIRGWWDIVSGSLGALYNWFVTEGLPFISQKVNDFVGLLKGLWGAVSPHLTDFLEGIAGIFGAIETNVVQPVIDAINGVINAVKDALTWLGILKTEEETYFNSTEKGGRYVPDFGGGTAGFSDGGWTGGAGRGDVAGVVHEREWVIPTRGGPLLREGGNANRQPEMMFGPGAVLIYANDAAGGARAADAFQRRLTELRRSKGR